MNFNKFLSSFNKNLTEIESAGNNPKDGCIKTLELCDSELTQLKKHVLLNAFKSIDEEIHFFKYVKPTILSERMFCQHKLQYLVGLPVIDIDSQKNYIIKLLSNRDRFIKKHYDLKMYIDYGHTGSDELYFLRKNLMFSLNGAGKPNFMDSGFSTNKDIVLAKLLAFNKLKTYLQREYYRITNPNKSLTYSNDLKHLEWTGTKSALVELIYALNSSKVINNGKTDIKHIASVFESALNVEIGDIYKIFSDIKYRQKSQTKFLEEMIINLKEDIDKSFR